MLVYIEWGGEWGGEWFVEWCLDSKSNGMLSGVRVVYWVVH